MGIEEKVPSGVLLTSVEKLVNWSRKSSFWPATFGLACCAIEMMATGAARYDLARFGMEVFRASPRQADLMIVAGRVSQKMAPVLRQIYDQMPDPKWVLSMGVCASSGGMFNNYAIVQGVDHVVPVDMYLPGCPPRPEMLIDAILKLHEKVMAEPLGARRVKALEAKEARDGAPDRRARRDAVELPLRQGPQGRVDPGGLRRPRGAAADRELDEGRGAHVARQGRSPWLTTAACSASPAPVTPPASAAWSAGARRCSTRPGRTAATTTRSSTRSRRPFAGLPRRDREGRRRPRRADAAHRSRSGSPTSARRCATTTSLRFELCSSVSGVDYLGTDERRLHAVYHLTSMTYRRRIRLEAAVTAEDPHLPSVTSVYPTADWQERETYDMFGIVFDGHPGLTRILMPDDWEGHPQRKDYPLGGIPVEYKGAEIPPPDERRSYQ